MISMLTNDLYDYNDAMSKNRHPRESFEDNPRTIGGQSP